MSKQFIAIEEPITKTQNGISLPVGVYNLNKFGLFVCDEQRCVAAFDKVGVEVTKESQPKTYRNFKSFHDSSDVFRAKN